jgi:hypothetical protein
LSVPPNEQVTHLTAGGKETNFCPPTLITAHNNCHFLASLQRSQMDIISNIVAKLLLASTHA